MRPNIFEYATSELSQDAFICWLLEWARIENKETSPGLHEVGTKFISELFRKAEIPLPEKIDKIEIIKQAEKIDILCVINDIYPIIIEDKTNSENHSNQLEKYFKKISRMPKFDPRNIIPIYFKTGNQIFNNNEKVGKYYIFSRKHFLEILNYGYNISIKNEVFNDYRNYLLRIEASTKNFNKTLFSKWDYYSWTGFLVNLGERLGDGTLVASDKRHLGLWWHWKVYDSIGIYIRINSNVPNIAIKLESVNNKVIPQEVRNRYLELLFSNNDKPDLFHFEKTTNKKGKCITIAKLNSIFGHFNQNNLIDIEKTITVIKSLNNIVDKVHNDIKKA